MAQHSRLWLIVATIETILIVFCVSELTALGDGAFHLYALDVGQGDSIVLRSPSGKQILIDGGPNMDALSRLPEEMPFLDRTIELLVLTHPDADHVTALPEILRRYKVNAVLMTGITKKSARYEEFLSMIRRKQIPVLFPDPAKDIDMGDGLVLDIIWPQPDVRGKEIKDANNTSVTMRAMFKDHTILLTGDIEEKVEQQILASGADIDSDILKVPHHGSRTSSSTGFLLAVTPHLGVIPVAKDSQYGHPHPDVVERYEYFGIPLRMTSVEGTVEVVLR